MRTCASVGAIETKEIGMSNDPKVIKELNNAIRKTDQAIREMSYGRDDYQLRVEITASIAKAVALLDERVVELEKKLSQNG